MDQNLPNHPGHQAPLPTIPPSFAVPPPLAGNGTANLSGTPGGPQRMGRSVIRNSREYNMLNIANTSRQTSPARHGGMDPELFHQSDEVMNKMAQSTLNNCLVLQRNFEACVTAAKSNQDPTTRIRYNDPKNETAERPMAKDVGYLLREIANSTFEYGIELHKLSDILVRDEELMRGSKQYATTKKTIQNNMDAARYMAPALQNFAKMIIPLSEPVPRRLIVTTPKPRSSSRSSSANPSQRNANQEMISMFLRTI